MNKAGKKQLYLPTLYVTFFYTKVNLVHSTAQLLPITGRKGQQKKYSVLVMGGKPNWENPTQSGDPCSYIKTDQRQGTSTTTSKQPKKTKKKKPKKRKQFILYFFIDWFIL